MGEAKRVSAVDEIDVAVAEAIQACGGDMRATIEGLIRAQWAMDREREETVSAGYVRRRLSVRATLGDRLSNGAT